MTNLMMFTSSGTQSRTIELSGTLWKNAFSSAVTSSVPVASIVAGTVYTPGTGAGGDGGGGGESVGLWNMARAQRSCPRVTEHVALFPEHDPPQRVKAQLLDALARSVTRVPEANVAVHRPGHEMPSGVLVTLPPRSAFTVSFVR